MLRKIKRVTMIGILAFLIGFAVEMAIFLIFQVIFFLV